MLWMLNLQASIAKSRSTDIKAIIREKQNISPMQIRDREEVNRI